MDNKIYTSYPKQKIIYTNPAVKSHSFGSLNDFPELNLKKRVGYADAKSRKNPVWSSGNQQKSDIGKYFDDAGLHKGKNKEKLRTFDKRYCVQKMPVSSVSHQKMQTDLEYPISDGRFFEILGEKLLINQQNMILEESYAFDYTSSSNKNLNYLDNPLRKTIPSSLEDSLIGKKEARLVHELYPSVNNQLPTNNKKPKVPNYPQTPPLVQQAPIANYFKNPTDEQIDRISKAIESLNIQIEASKRCNSTPCLSEKEKLAERIVIRYPNVTPAEVVSYIMEQIANTPDHPLNTMNSIRNLKSSITQTVLDKINDNTLLTKSRIKLCKTPKDLKKQIIIAIYDVVEDELTHYKTFYERPFDL